MFHEIINLPGGFRKKRYIWNHIRGKDFYLSLSSYLRDTAKEILYSQELTPEEASAKLAEVETVMNEILATEKKEDVKLNFVRNITKYVPIMTYAMLPYMSEGNIQKVLTADRILNDTTMQPIITEFLSLKRKLNESEQQFNDWITNVEV